MPKKNLVIAAVFAVLLHGGVALVRVPASQTHPLAEDKTLAISIIPEYKRSPKVSGVAAYTKKEEKGKRDDRDRMVPREKVKKRMDTSPERREVVTSPPSTPARISELPPSLQAEQETGTQTKKIVTVPPIPCYKSNPSPEYPELARRRGYEGEVLLSGMISVNGTVIALKVKGSSGHPILDRAAVKAVAMWEFEPARRMGSPVPLLVDIPVRFVLKRQ